MIFITGSSYPKAFLIKVLHVIKSIIEVVLTTIDSKPFEKANVISEYANLLPTPESPDKSGFCPKLLKMEKKPDTEQNTAIHAGFLNQLCMIESNQRKHMLKIEMSFDHLKSEAKDSKAQIAELKQSSLVLNTVIQNLTHENQLLVMTRDQQEREISFLKSLIPKKTLELPAVNSEISQGPEIAQRINPEVSEGATVYFEKINSILKSFPNIPTKEIIQLNEMNSDPEIRQFMKQQSSLVLNNYDLLCQKLWDFSFEERSRKQEIETRNYNDVIAQLERIYKERKLRDQRCDLAWERWQGQYPQQGGDLSYHLPPALSRQEEKALQNSNDHG